MTAIYSSAALKTRQREVKDAARREVVHVTENGNAAFVLLSEELYEQKLAEAREEAAYAERMRATIRSGRIDRSEGRVIVGTENLFAAVESIRSARG
ncbi:MAG: hypothetical protein Q4A07_00975 [Coriobacteriales bacterium]|nr:hypothetical protein [Coriobacteriales bacterium]